MGRTSLLVIGALASIVGWYVVTSPPALDTSAVLRVVVVGDQVGCTRGDRPVDCSLAERDVTGAIVRASGDGLVEDAPRGISLLDAATLQERWLSEGPLRITTVANDERLVVIEAGTTPHAITMLDRRDGGQVGALTAEQVSGTPLGDGFVLSDADEVFHVGPDGVERWRSDTIGGELLVDDRLGRDRLVVAAPMNLFSEVPLGILLDGRDGSLVGPLPGYPFQIDGTIVGLVSDRVVGFDITAGTRWERAASASELLAAGGDALLGPSSAGECSTGRATVLDVATGALAGSFDCARVLEATSFALDGLQLASREPAVVVRPADGPDVLVDVRDPSTSIGFGVPIRVEEFRFDRGLAAATGQRGDVIVFRPGANALDVWMTGVPDVSIVSVTPLVVRSGDRLLALTVG